MSKKMTKEQQKLVLDNENLVHYTIQRYFKMFIDIYDYDDLQSIGMLALCDASILYDKTRGVNFSTYAVNSIYRNIERKLLKRRYGVFRRLEENKAVKLQTMDKNIHEDNSMTLKDMLIDNTIDDTVVETRVLMEQFIDKINNLQDKLIFKLSIQNKPAKYIIKELRANRIVLGRQSVYNRKEALFEAFRNFLKGKGCNFKYPRRQALTCYDKENDIYICYKNNAILKKENINIAEAERAATTGEKYNGLIWNWGTFPLDKEGGSKRSKRRVKGVNIETGEEIIFESAYKAQENGFIYHSVSKCARGESKQHKGYKWYYI